MLIQNQAAVGVIVVVLSSENKGNAKNSTVLRVFFEKEVLEMLKKICKETQKKAFKGNIIDYPVQEILIVDHQTFLITCRNSNMTKTFQEVNKSYKESLILESETRNFELIKISQIGLVLRGEDAQKVLADYANTGLLSESLLTEVTDTIASQKSQPCVIL